MKIKFNKSNLVLATLLLNVLCITSIPITEARTTSLGNAWIGPFVNRIIYEVIQDSSQQTIALVDGDVDIIGRFIDPYYISTLSESEDVDVFETLRLGYGAVEINCKKYPMNMTQFRRAVAFAVDKHRAIKDGWLGTAALLDCHIPQQHPLSIEDDMGYHYYDKNLTYGISLLQAAGFYDTDDDDWMEGPGPDGPGTVELEQIVVEGHPTSQIDIFVDCVVDALHNLGIPAKAQQTHSNDYTERLYNHSDYDMIFRSINWASLDLDYYARDMSTDYIDVDGYNAPNWSNATWDSYVDAVLHAIDYDDIIAAVKVMEAIWVHACPQIIMYQNKYYTTYRNDTFDGVTNHIFDGAPNYFTNLRAHNKTGRVISGNYTWAQPLDILSFNHLRTNSAYADNILEMLFDSLAKIGPDGNDILWMAEDVKIENHDDNSTIPDGHTRITVDIIRNATWSNGRRITADDFVFTLNFLRNHVYEDGGNLANMTTCYNSSTYQLVCEFDSESYWHWHKIAYEKVIPSEIWDAYGNAYDDYQPSPSQLDSMILSGPFLPEKWVQGDYVILIQNSHYWKNPRLDSTAPSIDVSPADIEYVEGDTGHAISWQASDLYPESFKILKNGTEIKSGLWNSSDEIFSISVDGLEPGVYNYTLHVRDCAGNSASDEVIVKITEEIPTLTTTTTTPSPTSTTTTTPLGPIPLDMSTLIIIAGAVGLMVVVLVVLFRKKG